MRHRRGLVVGKFSPLHLGHEALIAFARERCDELLVLSWSSPEFDRCKALAREQWLAWRCPGVRSIVLDVERLATRCRERGIVAMRLPANDAPDDEQRDFTARVLIDLLDQRVDAVFTSEDYGDGFAASLADRFGTPVAHVGFDRARARWPVSGTALRSALDSRTPVAPESISAEVAADLVPRICLLGGESSGKTTLSRALAAALDTVWVAEYGRERWEQIGGDGVFSIDELVDVAETQVRRELEAAEVANGWLICDTTPLTTLQYCLLDHGAAPDRLRQLARRHYDLVIVCDGDFGFVQDGSRRDDGFRQAQQRGAQAMLDELGIAYEVVRGSIEQRLARVLALLSARRES